MSSDSFNSLVVKVKNNFLAHRLNRPEMIHMVEELQDCRSGKQSMDGAEAKLQEFSEISTDWRGQTKMSYDDAIAMLRLNDDFKSLSQDKVWTPYDKAVYRRLSAPINDPSAPSAQQCKSGDPKFVAVASNLLPRLDLDHNGHLSPLELDKAMRASDYTAEETASIVMLRRNGVQVSTCVADGDGVSLEDLKAFQSSGIPNDAATTSKLNKQLSSLTKQVQELPELRPLLEENMDPNGLTQGRAGSCVMLSTVLSRDEAVIRKMFQDNQDGTITVNFLDGEKETVNDLSPSERIYHAHGEGFGRWPGVLEKAMGQRIARKRPPADGSFRTSINGQSPQETISAFSGRKAVIYELDKLTPNQTRTLLGCLNQEDGPVIFGSRSVQRGADDKISVESLKTGVANNHAYAAQNVKYDPTTDEVFPRNPWGRGEWTIKMDGQDDGKFSIPALDFYSNYSRIYAPAPPSTVFVTNGR